MGHLLSCLFFLGLLVALGMIIESTLRRHWPAIVAAMRGAPR
jgi:hypothetical protein